MDQTGFARAAIARLTARRFGRDVPEVELLRELAAGGIALDRCRDLLVELQERRLAQRTAAGWRLVSPRVEFRARTPTASLAWIH